MIQSIHNHIIYFDGICNYCNSVVQFIIRHDKNKKFKFAALQSAYGQTFLRDNQFDQKVFNTFIYQKEGVVFTKSTAALLVSRELSGGWKVFYVLIFVPSVIRDFFYDLIARNRYRIFGKRESCMVPTKEIRERFIE